MSEQEIIWGFAGLLAGAILTGLTSAASEWHQRHLTKRAAARVIYANLFRSKDILSTALEEGEWAEFLPSFPFDDWFRYRDSLSAAMPAWAFHRVAGAYYGLETLDHYREADPATFLTNSAEDSLVQVTKAIAVIFDEGVTRRDVRAFGHEDGTSTELEPGDEYLAPAPDGSGDLVVGRLLGPSPPIEQGGSEIEMTRIEVEGGRYAVPTIQIQEIAQ